MITLYRSRPAIVYAEQQRDGSFLVYRDGASPDRVTAAAFTAAYEPARGEDLHELRAQGFEAPTAPPARARRSARRTARHTGGNLKGRTKTPTSEVLDRARALWRAGSRVQEIARQVSAMGRGVTPHSVYGWAERYKFGPRGKSAEKKTLSHNGAGARGA